MWRGSTTCKKVCLLLKWMQTFREQLMKGRWCTSYRPVLLSFIIYCLNCIRRDRNSSYKTGLKYTANILGCRSWKTLYTLHLQCKDSTCHRMSKKRPTLYVLWYYYVGIDAVTEIGLSWFLKLVLYISSAWKTIVPIVWCFKLFVSLISI